jgi:hypothetical protein
VKASKFIVILNVNLSFYLIYSPLRQAIAPLKKAADAIELVTDNLSIDEAISAIINLYQQI